MIADHLTPVRDWMFRALMFEADAQQFQTAGYRIGADQTDAEVRLMEEVLSPFPVELRGEAMRMTRLYALVYCFENSVRELIRERMTERHGQDWWDKKVSTKVKSAVQAIRDKAERNIWLEGERGDNLQFSQFGHLADIITNCWEDFSDLIPSQAWIRQRMDELEQARNFMAHNRMLMDSEFRRFETYVGDWTRQVGV